MKKIITVIMAAILIFTSCGTLSQSTPPRNYEDIVNSILSEDEKANFAIVTAQSPDSKNVYDMLSVSSDSVDDFAAAISYISTNAFFVGVFKATEGKQSELEAALLDYLSAQQKSMENYLPSQLEIVKNAQVKKVGKDEVFIALGVSSDEQAQSIKKLLK